MTCKTLQSSRETRYVVLHHQLPSHSKRRTHWDLMIQRDDVLITWALEEVPTDGIDIPAIKLPDHRLDYLDYEGPVSNDRGSVSRWDAGICLIESQDKYGLQATLQGNRLRGQIVLRTAKGQDSAVGEPQRMMIRFTRFTATPLAED